MIPAPKGTSIGMVFRRDGDWLTIVSVATDDAFRGLSRYYGPSGFDESGRQPVKTHETTAWSKSGESAGGYSSVVHSWREVSSSQETPGTRSEIEADDRSTRWCPSMEALRIVTKKRSKMGRSFERCSGRSKAFSPNGIA